MDESLGKLQKNLNRGCTTLMYACQNGLTSKVINEIRNKPQSLYKRDRHNKTALHYCSTQRHLLAPASVMINAPELIDSTDEDGFTPLHLAVIQGNTSLVNLLLSQKVNINALDNEGHSVVHWATVCGELDALRACLTAGADIMTPDINGASPLHFAAQICGANYEGRSDKASSKLALDILQELLEHPSINVDDEDKDGRTPLLWAASAGSEKAVLQLVKSGAKVESSDKDGLTALHCASSKGHTPVIDTLVKLCGADVDLIDSNGCSALHYATTLGHADAVSLLLDLGADPNRSDRKGRTPAHCGCNKGQLETVKLIGGRKGNLWLRNAKGDLPIHEACQSGRKDLVQWLLEQKPIHVNTANNDGKSLLHIAASQDNSELCKMLLDFGGDINAIYRTAKNVVLSPLDIAVQRGFRSTAKFLQGSGGLPAQKLKITGKRPSLSAGSTDSELIKPGKFVEKEEVYDIKKSKKYVVYVKRSDSVSDDERIRSRPKARQCHHHHRRRTRSCSNGHRSKCRGRRGDSSEGSSDECCSECHSDDSGASHTRSHQVICDYKKKRKKKRGKCKNPDHKVSDESSKSDSETDKKGKPEPKKKQSTEPIKGCSHDEDKTNGKKRPQSAKSTNVPKRKSKSSEDEEKLKNEENEKKEVTFDVDEKEKTFILEAPKEETPIQEVPLKEKDQTEIDTTDTPKKEEKELEPKKEEKRPQTAKKDEKQSEAVTEENVPDKTNNEEKPQEAVEKDEKRPKTAKKDEKTNEEKRPETAKKDEKRPEKPESAKPKKPKSEKEDEQNKVTVNINIKYDEKKEDKKKRKKEVEPEKAEKETMEKDSRAFQVLPDDRPKTTKPLLEQQGSKEEDSGFEPSPRSMRSKTSRKSIKSFEDPGVYHRAVSGKPYYLFEDEKRKPGDKNAVNMTTVSRSIQKNMKRYYMEKKIFQHLLELKGLQIRSNKSNESQIVRRAIDDYHKAIGNEMPQYPHDEYTFKNFELFLYETLRSLQKRGSHNFQNLSEVYREAERRLSVSDLLRSERALQCTTKTHRCLHAVHSYTGIPCVAYIPQMNHHTIPKLGFGPYKPAKVGKFYLPKILTGNKSCSPNVALELTSQGGSKAVIPLPADRFESNKRYYITLDVDDAQHQKTHQTQKK